MLSMGQELNLSQDQVRRLQGLRDGFEKQAIKLRSEIQSGQVDLSDLLAANPPDMKKIEAQEQKIAGLQAQSRIARIKVLTEARAVLTPEQWEQFQSAVPPVGLARRRGQAPQGYGPYAYGPYGMGPGMMGGYGGYGARGDYRGGMMGGNYGPYGMGPGMMGGYGAWGSGL
jgi:Spy/CpxP family protein refolding chaperone